MQMQKFPNLATVECLTVQFHPIVYSVRVSTVQYSTYNVRIKSFPT